MSRQVATRSLNYSICTSGRNAMQANYCEPTLCMCNLFSYKRDFHRTHMHALRVLSASCMSVGCIACVHRILVMSLHCCMLPAFPTIVAYTTHLILV